MYRRRRAGSGSIGRHDHVLLCTHGHSELADDNSTTAYTFTEATKTIKVTVSIADLPSISYFHVSCPDLQDSPFRKKPEIIWSSEDLVLFHVLPAGPGPREFFIYRAGPEPSLDLLHGVGAYFRREILDSSLLAVVPDGDGGNFVLATFDWDWGSARRRCNLDVFRSKRRSWTKEHLAPDFPSWMFTNRPGFSPDKVIAVRGGALGYVDLWKGILLCKVLEEPVTTRFIPLPNPLPGNRKGYNHGSSARTISPSWARLIRDVACTDGLTITCVEMEDLYCFIARTPDGDVLHDSDIDPSEETGERRWVGWRLVTWYREISWDYWRKGCVLHVDELGTVSLPRHPARTEPLPPKGPEPSSSGPTKLPLGHMLMFCPILCGEGVVCFLSKRDSYYDHHAWIVTVDMRKKAVRGLAPYYDETPMVFNLAYISCALKKYLKSESDEGGSLVVEDTTGSHGKRRRSSLENTRSDSSQPKRTLRGSTMEQRKLYG